MASMLQAATPFASSKSTLRRASTCRHMRERFHDLLAKTEDIAYMLAKMMPKLQSLQPVPFAKRISLQDLRISHEARIQGHQPFQCLFGFYESVTIYQTDSRSSTYNLRTFVERYEFGKLAPGRNDDCGRGLQVQLMQSRHVNKGLTDLFANEV